MNPLHELLNIADAAARLAEYKWQDSNSCPGFFDAREQLFDTMERARRSVIMEAQACPLGAREAVVRVDALVAAVQRLLERPGPFCAWEGKHGTRYQECVRAMASLEDLVLLSPAQLGKDGRDNKKKGVNAKMAEKFQGDIETEESWGWTARQWADYVGCSPASVVATATWKRMASFRLKDKAHKRCNRWQKSKARGDG